MKPSDVHFEEKKREFCFEGATFEFFSFLQIYKNASVPALLGFAPFFFRRWSSRAKCLTARALLNKVSKAPRNDLLFLVIRAARPLLASVRIITDFGQFLFIKWN